MILQSISWKVDPSRAHRNSNSLIIILFYNLLYINIFKEQIGSEIGDHCKNRVLIKQDQIRYIMTHAMQNGGRSSPMSGQAIANKFLYLKKKISNIKIYSFTNSSSPMPGQTMAAN